MFDFVLGLPMHALVIHAVVVLVPLSALCTVAYVARPSWRTVLVWPTAAGALISGISAFVAAESGEKLLVRVSTTRASTTNFELLANHTMWGDRAKVVCLVFMVLALAAAFLMSPPLAGPGRPRSKSATARRGSVPSRAARWRAVALQPAVQAPLVQTTLGVVVVVVSLAALVVVALAGHAGAQVVWDGLG
ncbi:MAG: DUF2231 domain-containing protein [Terracoccus sp.]